LSKDKSILVSIAFEILDVGNVRLLIF
jgi:hypothetical protein